MGQPFPVVDESLAFVLITHHDMQQNDLAQPHPLGARTLMLVMMMVIIMMPIIMILLIVAIA